MLAQMVGVLAHILALFVSVLGGHLLLSLIILLLGLVSSDLVVIRLLIATFSLSLALAFALDNISKLVLKLEMFHESIECSQHGNNVLIIRGFGSPSSLSLEVVTLVVGKGHKCIVGHSKELPVKPVIMVVADVLLEVVTWDDKIGIKQEPNRIFKGGAASQQL